MINKGISQGILRGICNGILVSSSDAPSPVFVIAPVVDIDDTPALPNPVALTVDTDITYPTTEPILPAADVEAVHAAIAPLNIAADVDAAFESAQFANIVVDADTATALAQPIVATVNDVDTSLPLQGFWTPADIDAADLRLWFESDDPATITESGGLVSQWDDKSTNLDHLTPVSAQPIIDTINGINAIRTQSAPMSAVLGTRYTNSVMLTVMVLEKTNSGSSNISLSDPGEADYQTTGNAVIGYSPSTIIQDYRASSALSTATRPSIGVPFVYTSLFDGTNHTVFINGDPSPSVASAGNFDWGTVALGSRYSQGSYSSQTDNKYGAMLMLSISDVATRQRAEGYLAHKFGISLVAGHPHENDSP